MLSRLTPTMISLLINPFLESIAYFWLKNCLPGCSLLWEILGNFPTRKNYHQRMRIWHLSLSMPISLLAILSIFTVQFGHLFWESCWHRMFPNSAPSSISWLCREKLCHSGSTCALLAVCTLLHEHLVRDLPAAGLALPPLRALQLWAAHSSLCEKLPDPVSLSAA